MPKIVDHEERRREFIVATWRVIQRSGLSRTTMRQISEEAGYSSGAIVHYFSDKSDLLAQSLEAAHQEVRDMFDASIAERSLEGLELLREYMLACLPLDDHRQRLAAVEVAFWGEAIGDAELIELNEVETKLFSSKIEGLLREAQTLGETAADMNIAVVAKRFRYLMDGISLQSVLTRGYPTPEEQIEMLDDLIASVRLAHMTT